MTISTYLPDKLSGTTGRSLAEVFSKQLKLNAVPATGTEGGSASPVQTLHATVSIIGDKILGLVLLQVTETFAGRATELLLGSRGKGDEIKDVIGELCNMISGRIKAELAVAGFSGRLGIPTVTVGSRIDLEQSAHSELCVTDWISEGHPISLQVQIRLLSS